MGIDTDTRERWEAEDHHADHERSQSLLPSHADILALNTLLKSEWFYLRSGVWSPRLSALLTMAQQSAIEQFPEERPE